MRERPSMSTHVRWFVDRKQLDLFYSSVIHNYIGHSGRPINELICIIHLRQILSIQPHSKCDLVQINQSVWWWEFKVIYFSVAVVVVVIVIIVELWLLCVLVICEACRPVIFVINMFSKHWLLVSCRMLGDGVYQSEVTV